MSQITATLLRQMVGVQSGRPLIDKLVGPLNLVLPAYGITTELRIAAFLATCAPESDWFKTLREYGKGAGRKYGRAINGLVYYGRGIFQVTWLRNYQLFTAYVARNWESIKPRAAKYKYTVPPDFVADPELLATPYWAVEAACWYWRANGLAPYADRGLKGFFGLQGLVNRGDATKKALHYDARLGSYETARRVLSDDFALSNTSAATPADDPTGENAESSESAITSSEHLPKIEPPPTDEGSQAIGEHLPAKVEITEAGGIKAETNVQPSQNVVIEKEKEPEAEKPKGVFGSLKAKIISALGGSLSTDVAIDKAQEAQALGLSPETWKFIFYVVVGGLLLWILYEVWIQKVWPWLRWLASRWRTHRLMDANSTPTNSVVVESDLTPERIAALEKAGWIVVRRG